MMLSMFELFCLKVLEILDLEVFEFGVFSELAILEWFLTCRKKTLHKSVGSDITVKLKCVHPHKLVD